MRIAKSFVAVAFGTLFAGSFVVPASSVSAADRDRGETPQRHHFQTSCTGLLTAPGELFCPFSIVMTDRQLLVIETVTASVAFSTGFRPASMAIQTTSAGRTAEHVLVPIPVAVGVQIISGPVDTFAVNQPVRLYQEGGSLVGNATVEIAVVPGGVAPYSSIYATISGYMLDCGSEPNCELP
jgi:hypothetical protein